MNFLPKTPVTVIVTDTSTSWVLVNASSFTKTYTLVCTNACYIRRGRSDVSAATSDDFLLPANVVVRFDIPAGEGVRAIRFAADGRLQIGDLSV